MDNRRFGDTVSWGDAKNDWRKGRELRAASFVTRPLTGARQPTRFAATDTLGTLTGVRIFGALGFWKRVRSATLDDTRSRLLLTLAGGRFVLLPVFILQACRRMEGSLLAFSLISILGFTQGAIGVACMKECPDAAVAGMKGGSDRALDQTRSRAMLSQEYGGYLATIATLLGVCVGASCSIPLNMLFS